MRFFHYAYPIEEYIQTPVWEKKNNDFLTRHYVII